MSSSFRPPQLVEAGYALELADAPLLHRGLGLADLAHVLALHEAGVLPAEQTAILPPALLDVLDCPAEKFPYDPAYGDAYNSRERELERRLGSVAGWLHTGRTRREAGRIAFRADPYQLLSADVPYRYLSDTTIYTRYGDWFAWSCLVIALIAVVITRAGSRAHRHP